MHNLLIKLLAKRNVKVEDLDKEERQDFDRWEKILSGGEVTVDRVGEFCKAQISAIEAQWKNLDNDQKKNERLIIAHTIYSTILKTLTAPEIERSALESYLNKLINQ